MSSPAVEVWAAVTLAGWHRWPSAPAHRDYLASRHRHQFCITASVAVGHDDRDVEFHDLRDVITQWWIPDQGDKSCEAIGRDLQTHLAAHGLTPTRITVSEDGYDGATLTWQ